VNALMALRSIRGTRLRPGPERHHVRADIAGDGYRSAKRQGKPNFTIASKRLRDRNFCDSAFSARAARLHPVHRDT